MGKVLKTLSSALRSLREPLKCLHSELVRWRIPHVTMLVIFVMLEVEAWEFYKQNFEVIENGKAVAFLGFNAAVVSIITVCLKFMGSKYEKDEHD